MGDLSVTVSSERLLMVMTYYDFSDKGDVFGWGNSGGSGSDDDVC